MQSSSDEKLLTLKYKEELLTLLKDKKVLTCAEIEHFINKVKAGKNKERALFLAVLEKISEIASDIGSNLGEINKIASSIGPEWTPKWTLTLLHYCLHDSLTGRGRLFIYSFIRDKTTREQPDVRMKKTMEYIVCYSVLYLEEELDSKDLNPDCMKEMKNKISQNYEKYISDEEFSGYCVKELVIKLCMLAIELVMEQSLNSETKKKITEEELEELCETLTVDSIIPQKAKKENYTIL